MAAATDVQVQHFVDNFVRPRANQILQLLSDITADQAQIGDVYTALTAESPTWTDQRSDGPPHFCLPSDVLAWNTFVALTLQFWNGSLDAGNVAAAAAQLSIIRKIATR